MILSCRTPSSEGWASGYENKCIKKKKNVVNKTKSYQKSNKIMLLDAVAREMVVKLGKNINNKSEINAVTRNK
jgi:hypothetical protein